MSKQRRIPTPSWEQDSGIAGGLSGGRAKVFGLIAIILLVVVAVGVVGAGFLMDYIDDQNRPGSTALRVDDRKYTVKDYTERAKIYVTQTGGNSGANSVIPAVTQDLIEESILIQNAAAEGVEATDEEVKAAVATLLGITADDPNFDARFQEELGTVDLTEEEYRDMARGNVLQEKLTKHFQDNLPATAESLRYSVIQVADQATAVEIKVLLDEGGDFATIAKEQSTDTTTKEAGGDAGWVPRGYLSEQQENVLFGLTLDESIVFPGSSGVFIYRVTEREDAHAIDEDKKPTLAAQQYSEWFTDKQEAAEITNHVDGSDVDIINYVVDHAELT